MGSMRRCKHCDKEFEPKRHSSGLFCSSDCYHEEQRKRRREKPKPTEKRCTKCTATKPLIDFDRMKKSSDGRREVCKSCRSLANKNDPTIRQKRRAFYAKNQTRLRAKQSAYNAAHREEIASKARKRYHERPKRLGAPSNRERARARSAEYRARNKDKLKVLWKTYASVHRAERNAYERRHRKTHPEWEKSKRHNRRARKRAGGRFTPAEWRKLCAIYAHRCLACGRGDVKLTPDHVIPLCHGGSNRIENIQPLCLRCNLNKHRQHTDYRVTWTGGPLGTPAPVAVADATVSGGSPFVGQM